jgi:hypothetical protein
MRSFNGLSFIVIFGVVITLWISGMYATDRTKLEQERVRVLDSAWDTHTNNPERYNVLFRSNRPTDGDQTEFLYDTWLEYMINAAKDRGIYLSRDQKLYLKVFSVLQYDDKTNDLEKTYFDAHPSKGEISVWPIVGTKADPQDYSTSEITSKSKSLSWIADPIDSLIDTIYSELHNFNDTKHCVGCISLIVIHCTHGKDRTGEISGAYNLKYKHQTWKEVDGTNWEMANWRITYENQKALTWYCYHLAYHQNYALNCTVENVSKDTEVKPAMVGWDESDDGVDGYMVGFYVLLSILSTVAVVITLIAITVIAKWSWKRLEMSDKIHRRFSKSDDLPQTLDESLDDIMTGEDDV